MFRDECEIDVRGGEGGDGAVSFLREKFVPFGGPDGGNGGDGGSVILEATESVNSLLRVGRSPLYSAEGGRPGGPRNRSGSKGSDQRVQVPIGTQIYDAVRGHLFQMAGDPERAIAHFRAAAEQTASIPERDYLMLKAARLR